MRLEEIRQQFQGEFVLRAVTKTDADNVEVLAGAILAHSPHRHEMMELLGQGLARDVAVEALPLLWPDALCSTGIHPGFLPYSAEPARSSGAQSTPRQPGTE